MNTDSEALLTAGCELAKQTWHDFCTAMHWSAHSVGRTVCHQVGSAHRDAMCASLGLLPDKDFTTFGRLGNMGTVSLPATLAISTESHPPADREQIALLGIGSGLSSVMLGLVW